MVFVYLKKKKREPDNCRQLYTFRAGIQFFICTLSRLSTGSFNY